MCGLAFSGKSSTARRVASELGATLISLDAINHERNLRDGDGIPISEWERTSHIAMQRLETALRSGASAVVDDTFSHRFLRDRARSVAEECGSRFVILYMDTPIAVIEERRAANYRNPARHNVRDDVFAAHRDGFQHPDVDEPVVRVRDDLALKDWLACERNSN
jgi:predicted kinase